MQVAIVRIVELLSSGDFVSGAVLGDALGVSRTAVWKYLNTLTEWGVSVEKVKGRGYRISGGMELLCAERILASMPSSAPVLIDNLIVLPSVDSTNNVARSKIECGTGSGFVCIAERQTGGRGRHGRQWLSPFGRNLYMSLVWNFEGGAAALEGLSLAVGVAAVRAIRSLGVEGLALKWPNDILLEGRKLGGVLLEMMGDPVGSCQVIVGIGINLGMPEDSDVGQPWADLSRHGAIGRNKLAGALLSELLPMLEAYSANGFSTYRAEWESWDAHRDALVELRTPRTAVQGYARGVSETGAILIEVSGQTESYTGGELSLRRVDDT